jgi:low affinity Fe/Cu permease
MSRMRAMRRPRENHMFGIILVVLLILVLIGAMPTWPHSRNWGFYPTSGIGLILMIVVVLMLVGAI